MSQVEEIEIAVQNLPARDLLKFRQWFSAFDAQAWDSQLETDIAKGKLNSLANSAIEEHKNGQSRKL